MNMVVSLDDVRDSARLRASLHLDEKKNVLATVSNMIAIFRHDPSLRGIVTKNEFTDEAAITRAPPSPDETAKPMPGPYPRAWTDADEALILAYIQRQWTVKARPEMVHAAMIAVAALAGFHPIRDWLTSLVWDGHRRLDRWLTDAFGTPPSQYSFDVGATMLIAGVRRVMVPGTKFDYMAVLEGNQGIGKSTALKILAGSEWFTDSIPHDLTSKDAVIGLAGAWIVEMAEIDQLIRNDIETIKAFLSRAVDKYRPPYGRNDVVRPRQGIIIGTTNAADYLRDVTGNRRFWPIKCSFVDQEWLRANRDQLWAEAVVRHHDGAPLWLTDEVAATQAIQEQEARLVDDVWDAKVAKHVAGLGSVALSDILETALMIPTAQQDRRAQMRVASILKRLGWEVVVMRVEGVPRRMWMLRGN